MEPALPIPPPSVHRTPLTPILPSASSRIPTPPKSALVRRRRRYRRQLLRDGFSRRAARNALSTVSAPARRSPASPYRTPDLPGHHPNQPRRLRLHMMSATTASPSSLVTFELLPIGDRDPNSAHPRRAAFYEGSDGPKMREGGWRKNPRTGWPRI